ncbi:MAG: NAD-dependent epimerase/dehydratase family protein [Erysipelotrichaceae bacterium]|nr:NAD-dependent epimerase/dehydratase family protein [Erysipelotrichaceae bacterium]
MPTSYLVTGATGHLGFNVIKALHSRGYKVRGLVLPDDPNIERLDGLATVFTGDIRDKSTLDEFFDCPSTDDICVIHCAAITTFQPKFSQEIWDINVVGTSNILDMCKVFHVKKLVYVSSVAAVPSLPGNEMTYEISEFRTDRVKGFYGKTKAAATSLVLEAASKGLDASVVHPSAVMGPDDYGCTHLTQAVQDYLHGQLPVTTKGGLDIVDVRDVAEGIISCLENGRQGECYFLTNKYYTVREILKIVHFLSGTNEVYLSIPGWMTSVSTPVFGVYYRLRKQRSLLNSNIVKAMQRNSNFSHEKARKELGYTTRSISETVVDTIDFLRKEGRI